MAKNAPTVTLLLNGLDVPNQVLQTGRRGASVKLSVRTDPPLETLPDANVEFANPDPANVELAGRKRGERDFRLKTGAPSGIAHPVSVTVRAGGREARVEKMIYALREASPQIRFEPSETGAARGARLTVQAAGIDLGQGGSVEPHWTIDRPHSITPDSASPERATIELAGRGGSASVRLGLLGPDGEPLLDNGEPIEAVADVPASSALDGGDDRIVRVTLQRSSARTTSDTIFWSYIRTQTNAMSARNYIPFINELLCPRADQINANGLMGPVSDLANRLNDLPSRPYGMAAYEVLKVATEIFLLTTCGALTDPRDWPDKVIQEESGRLGETLLGWQLRDRLQNYLGDGLPYLDRVIEAAFPSLSAGGIFCGGLVAGRIAQPLLLELIWSYWHEEGMLVQSMNAITRRFQNVRAPGDRDPLAHVEIDPLRPLNNLLWGYIQDEPNRLSVLRRSYEYDHHYGLTLYGKAVPESRTADSRSKFLEGFHNLLYRAYEFYKEDSDTTVIADGYPLLSALKEVHLLLAQGAHNQFGDLPWTARVEMLMQQWLLARQEMRDFLQSRPMVPYKEPWMAPVDTMKTLQGWSDVTVTHFSDLGVFGEQILLSVRYGDWVDINDEDSAKNWARYWRPEVQGYIHAYRAATGVDLSDPAGVDYTLPSIHLRQRLALQQGDRSAALPAPTRTVPRLQPAGRRRTLPSPADFR